MESKLVNTKQRNELVSARRVTEFAAFPADVRAIREKVYDFERFIKRLKELVDEERTEALISKLFFFNFLGQLESMNTVDLDVLIEEIQKVAAEVYDARKISFKMID